MSTTQIHIHRIVALLLAALVLCTALAAGVAGNPIIADDAVGAMINAGRQRP